MKCPKCNYNHKKKEGHQCKSCGYNFIFRDPHLGYRISDMSFGKILDKVSAGGSRYFLSRQVQTAIASRPKSLSQYIILSIFISIFGSILVISYLSNSLGNGFEYLYPLPAVIIFGTAIYLYRRPAKWPSKVEVEAWLNAWQERFGELEYWVNKQDLQDERYKNTETEYDLQEYGVQKILIVDDPLLVDALVKNAWHLDQRTLVVSACGYPSTAAALANRYLSESNETLVYLLHSSAWPDFQAHVRSEGEILLGEHKVVDCGVDCQTFNNSNKLRKLYENVPDNVIHADQLPINVFHAGLAACLVGGLLMSDVVNNAAGASAFSIESDFG